MEIGEQRATVFSGKLKRTRKLGESTGEPIVDEQLNTISSHSNDEEVNSNNNNNNINLSSSFRVEKRKLVATKLAKFFKKSFFEEDQSAVGRAVLQTNNSIKREHQGEGSSTSSEEWQLLELEEDEDQLEVKDSNLRLGEEELSILRDQQLQDNNTMPGNNNNNNNNNNISVSASRQMLQNSRKRYLDIDPLNDRKKLSPALIHLCTALYALVPLASLCTFTTLVTLIFTRYWPVTVLYYTYVFLDRQTCNRGGCRWEAFYEAKFWSYLAAYFPIKLRHSREFKLDPSENYILNYHPHGIAAFGCVAGFATNALNFRQLFPGITSRFMVHETSYCVPLMREIFSLRGDCSVNSKSIDYFLEKKWRQKRDEAKESSQASTTTTNTTSGNLLAWVGGGLAEADLSDAETLKIVVATRKGFVKKALLHGAHLIPCIAFGENSVFTKINFKPNSLLDRLESQWYRFMKFKHPFYYGGSVLGSEKLQGAMPYKRPITVVMGDPIRVERVAVPTQQQVDELHARYLDELLGLYKANSDLCTRFDRGLQLV